jgi:hypothetical protein
LFPQKLLSKPLQKDSRLNSLPGARPIAAFGSDRQNVIRLRTDDQGKYLQAAFLVLKGHTDFKDTTAFPSMVDNGLHSLLWRNDRMGMMHSIESRFPFRE